MVEEARRGLMDGMARIARFWGAPEAMGAIYGAIFLSVDAVSLDDLVEAVGVSKGAVSVHARALERLGLIHRVPRPQDRKDYYEAGVAFWSIVRNILRERQDREFDRALATVTTCEQLLEGARKDAETRALLERVQALAGFFRSIDQLVGLVLALDHLRVDALEKLFGGSKRRT